MKLMANQFGGPGARGIDFYKYIVSNQNLDTFTTVDMILSI